MVYIRNYFFVLVLILAACTDPVSKTAGKKDHKVELKSTLPAPSNKASKSPVFSIPCAVLYIADTIKLDRIRKKIGEDAFYTIADDNMFYSSEALTFLKKKGMKIENTEADKFQFKTADGKTFKIKIPDDAWDILYLFDGKNPPIEADLTGIEESYKEYINKQ